MAHQFKNYFYFKLWDNYILLYRDFVISTKLQEYRTDDDESDITDIMQKAINKSVQYLKMSNIIQGYSRDDESVSYEQESGKARKYITQLDVSNKPLKTSYYIYLMYMNIE